MNYCSFKIIAFAFLLFLPACDHESQESWDDTPPPVMEEEPLFSVGLDCGGIFLATHVVVEDDCTMWKAGGRCFRCRTWVNDVPRLDFGADVCDHFAAWVSQGLLEWDSREFNEELYEEAMSDLANIVSRQAVPPPPKVAFTPLTVQLGKNEDLSVELMECTAQLALGSKAYQEGLL